MYSRDLDESMLRRFEKQIYIGPPNEKTRMQLFENFLPKLIGEKPRIEVIVDFDRVAQLTENYSGSDIKNVCKEVKMNHIREMFQKLETNKLDNDFQTPTKITTHDVETELIRFKPTIAGMKNKYAEWETKYNQKNLRK